MLVVADTSPFIALVKIGHVDILPRLYYSVTSPPQVAAELASPKRATEIQAFMASSPPWLAVRAPAHQRSIVGLDPGESAAIGLAQDAEVLLELQVLVDGVYARGRYGETLDYDRPLDPPLSAEDEAWADQLLRAAGER